MRIRGAIELGRRLGRTLFDQTGPTASHWLLTLEGVLFEAPLSALVTSLPGAMPRFLVEDRTLEIVPGAWAAGTDRRLTAGGFLGGW